MVSISRYGNDGESGDDGRSGSEWRSYTAALKADVMWRAGVLI